MFRFTFVWKVVAVAKLHLVWHTGPPGRGSPDQFSIALNLKTVAKLGAVAAVANSTAVAKSPPLESPIQGLLPRSSIDP